MKPLRTPLLHPPRKSFIAQRGFRMAVPVTLIVILYETAAVAQNVSGEAGGSTVVTSSRGWVLNAIIVAAVCGLALFAICRSSRRN